MIDLRRLCLILLLYYQFECNAAEAFTNARVRPARPVPAAAFRAVAPPPPADPGPFPPPGLPLKLPEDYQIVRRLGTGKFSDVFEAVDVALERRFGSTDAVADGGADTFDPRSLVVLKCLKPVSERKIRREIGVLLHTAAVPNLVRLRALVLPPAYFAAHRAPTDLPAMPSLVLEHAGVQAQWLCHGQGPLLPASGDSVSAQDVSSPFLSDYEIRYYLYHLLVALEGLHSVGVMHRDVKPRNVMINRRQDPQHQHGERPLVLIDLGLADFYVPHQRYNVRVASRHYKSPELLVGYEYYNYSLDLWGVGCVLLGLLLRREPFFRGKDNVDQLAKIVAVLGTADLLFYLRRYSIPVTSELQNILQKCPATRTDWCALVPEDCPRPSDEALDLLDRLLVYDHDGRLTAQQAMAHAYFDPVRDRVHAELGSDTTYQHPSRKLA